MTSCNICVIIELRYMILTDGVFFAVTQYIVSALL